MKQVKEAFICKEMLLWKLRLFNRLEGLPGSLSVKNFRRRKNRCLRTPDLRTSQGLQLLETLNSRGGGSR